MLWSSSFSEFTFQAGLEGLTVGILSHHTRQLAIYPCIITSLHGHGYRYETINRAIGKNCKSFTNNDLKYGIELVQLLRKMKCPELGFFDDPLEAAIMFTTIDVLKYRKRQRGEFDPLTCMMKG